MKLIPIQSILYNLATTIDPKYWNEDIVLEWAEIAAKKMGSQSLYILKQNYAFVKNFTFEVSEDVLNLVDVLTYKPQINNVFQTDETLKEYILRNTNHPNETSFWNQITKSTKLNNKWIPLLKINSGIFAPCAGLNQCQLSYKKNNNLSEGQNLYQTNFESGIIAYSYYAYASDKNESFLIPDNENYKEAIVNYIMYRHFDKIIKMDFTNPAINFLIQERNMHIQRHNILAQRAVADINLDNADQSTLENIKIQRNVLSKKHIIKDTLFNI